MIDVETINYSHSNAKSIKWNNYLDEVQKSLIYVKNRWSDHIYQRWCPLQATVSYFTIYAEIAVLNNAMIISKCKEALSSRTEGRNASKMDIMNEMVTFRDPYTTAQGHHTGYATSDNWSHFLFICTLINFEASAFAAWKL